MVQKMTSSVYDDFRALIRDKEEISVRYDVPTASVWCYFNPKTRPCYSYNMLREIHDLQLAIIDYFHKYDMHPKIPIHYFVLASQTSEIYNYGGDLNLFAEMIRKQERDTLFRYGQLGTEIVYLNSVNFNLPLTTVAVVEGTALGGGFEAVLSCNLSVVEEQCKLGLPEIRFNLFPGMGAYSLLARELGVRRAEEMITSGKVYSATEVHQMGLITTVVKKGEAVPKALKLMQKQNRLHNGMQAIAASRNRFRQVDHEEFLDINRIWVDAALRLEEKDLKVMQKLIEAQNQKYGHIVRKRRTAQDRRLNLPYEMFGLPVNRTQERRKGVDRRKIG